MPRPTPISRQDFVLVLARLVNADPDAYAEASVPLCDVQKGSYYFTAVAWAYENGISTGYTGGAKQGCFGVGDSITREQIVTILYRYARSAGKDIALYEDAFTLLAPYSDRSAISEWAFTPLCWSLEKGIIGGMNASTLAPGGHASRAQVAAIIHRLCDKNIF